MTIGASGFKTVPENCALFCVPFCSRSGSRFERCVFSFLFQCEICQKITDTKQDFVDHIKKFHINVVDGEVLKSLESDLKKSRKKAAKQATLQNGTGSKNFHKAATEPKSSPSKSPQKGKTLEELSPRYVLPLPQIV